VIEPLCRRNFALPCWGGLISETGKWFLLIGLPLAVSLLTGSAFKTRTAFIAALVAALLLGSITGVFTDHWGRRHGPQVV
jgi:hypothetical protein